ncbi:Transposable element P transposase [Frankliniella fusca]|uniref:Transposable element P transposase n=1 Tax=Frankliniella fusca TaxID=407009 RepID=A0AAE1HYB2_9NEOP|nr:Transposable element P transposase [Frankliniella fusca]
MMSPPDSTAKEPPKTKRKAGRKKISNRSKVKRPKERGKYTKTLKASGGDIAECVLSDEEVLDEYLEENPVNETSSDDQKSVLSSGTSASDSMSVDSISSMSSLCGSENISLSSPTPDSRPSSAPLFRTPRPPSPTGSVHSASSITSPEPLSPPPQEQCVVENTMDPETPTPSLELCDKGLQLFKSQLPKPWIVIVDQCGFHLLLPTCKSPISIQREIFLSFSGNVSIYMHNVLVPSFQEVFEISKESLVVFNSSSAEKFCQYGVSLVRKFLMYVTCVGANDMETKNVWYMLPGTYIDKNPYHEDRYEETCRSEKCLRIVVLGPKIFRCKECGIVMKKLKSRKDFMMSPDVDPKTKNQYLTRDQALHKMSELHETIRKKDKQLTYYKMKGILAAEGVNIDEQLSEQFAEILLSSPCLTENQRMFLLEQWSSSNKSDSRAHRWHPAMIRLALHLYTTSPACYNALRDSGVLKLPCSRTLFDYSHAIKAKEGINDGIVQLAHDIVEKHPESYKKYHVLLCDGMHISQNLAFRKQDGVMVGYANLDNVTEEMARLDKFLEGHDPVLAEPQLATEMLAYLVKGMGSSDVKFVVAAYPCKTLTKETMYRWTWDVIQELEIAGVKILAFVCDGLGVNRSFFQMHTPITTGTHFNVVFDTINVCSPERRPLYFISDVCHLLKTLRNGFYNSGEGEKKPRLLTINGQTIQWKTIVRLYFTYKACTFRKSYKLNAQNVFPNSYSKMKVSYAGQVLSNTVAVDLKAQNWEGTQETVRFISFCNRFFDILNGAHSSQGGRYRHEDLAPYSSQNIEDKRFDWLRNEFLKYLVDWKKQVDAMAKPPKIKEKMMLPQTTLNGIELSIRAIEGATKFYLKSVAEGGAGGPFLMARIFSQDPLEQHFSLQRQGGGGSRAPNPLQFTQKQVSNAISRNLGVRKRGANSAEQRVGHIICDEPLKKRKKVVNKK